MDEAGGVPVKVNVRKLPDELFKLCEETVRPEQTAERGADCARLVSGPNGEMEIPEVWENCRVRRITMIAVMIVNTAVPVTPLKLLVCLDSSIEDLFII